MNKEVKDLLYKQETFTILYPKERDVIIDYITNLQEENQMLKQSNKNTYETSQEMLAELTQENERLNKENNKLYDQISAIFYNTKLADKQIRDYKSRCEKAIEILKAMNHCDNWIGRKRTNIITLLNILQNGSDTYDSNK